MPFGGRVLRPLSGGQEAQALAPGSSSGLFSLTYEPYYGLKEKAFSLSADPRFLFRSPEHAPAFEELLNGIRRREGLITLTGEIGTGKTTLIRTVLQHLDRRTFSAFVPDPFVSREDLLKMLLVDFGVVSIADLKRGSLNGATRPDLSYPLYEFLDSLVPLQAFAVLIIDEAQNLPLPLLEEVRILSDLEGREKLLQVVLVGQPELRAHLRMPEMRQVDQRISVRCELTPLGRDGMRGYIEHRLNVASEGSARVEFSSAALAAIYEGSKGTPRLINLICDRALYHGYNARVDRIEPSFVWAAMSDLELESSPLEPAASAPAPQKAKAPQTTPSAAPQAGRSLFAERPADKAPASAAPVTKASGPVQRSASPVMPPQRELLNDFAPESGVDSSTASVRAGIARGWILVAASTLIAVLAMGGMLTYARVQTLSEMPTLTLPVPPKRIDNPLPAVAPPATQHFAIQIASFQTMERAEVLLDRLTSIGFEGRAVDVNVGEFARVVEVVVGDYPNPDAADSDLSRLRSVHGFVDAHIAPFYSTDAR